MKRWVSIKILIGYANFETTKLFFPTPPSLNQKSILQTVPEAENERPEVPQRMNNTRFWWNSSVNDDDDDKDDFCTINVWIYLINFPFRHKWIFLSVKFPLPWHFKPWESLRKMKMKKEKKFLKMLTLCAVNNNPEDGKKNIWTFHGESRAKSSTWKWEPELSLSLSVNYFPPAELIFQNINVHKTIIIWKGNFLWYNGCGWVCRFCHGLRKICRDDGSEANQSRRICEH